MNDREQFEACIVSAIGMDTYSLITKEMLNLLFIGWEACAESKQSELDKKTYLNNALASSIEGITNELDKANARIAQLEEALSYARYFSLDDKATAALNAVRDNPLPSTWLSEHDKAVEVKLLEELAKMLFIIDLPYISQKLFQMADSRK